MLTLLASVLLSAQPGVVVGLGGRASVVQMARVGKSNPNALPVSTELVMLTDVIAPRWGQRGYAEAARFSLDATLGEAISFEPRKPEELLQALGEEEETSLYGRVRVGKVWLHELLLEAGWAWVLPAARKDAALVKLEDAARLAKRGLWADEAPVEPWLWRELLLLRDVEGKVFHSGWECPHVNKTQCRQCGGGQFSGFDEAAAAGFAPHDVCMTADLLRFAKASGGGGDDDVRDEGPPKRPASPRRACVKDSECALTPLTPCVCSGCGVVWREAARKDVAARMKVNFSRANCGGVGCAACAGSSAGTRAVCREKQCVVDGPPVEAP